jgi:hypothetical protein
MMVRSAVGGVKEGRKHLTWEMLAPLSLTHLFSRHVGLQRFILKTASLGLSQVGECRRTLQDRCWVSVIQKLELSIEPSQKFHPLC